MHGTKGTPQGNWFPWLKLKLEELGHVAKTPQFPTPENQTIPAWLHILDRHVETWDDRVLLVGHSSACLAICAKLQQLERPITAAFMVAPFYGDIGNEEYDKYNRSFNSYRYDWNKARQNASNIRIYRSDADPYVPEHFGKLLSEFLHVQETIVPNAKHFGREFTEFPLLLRDIETVLASAED